MRRSAWPEPPAPRYTRLRGWFQSGESAWSLVAKFQLLNCLTLEQLLELVTPAEHRAREPLSFRFAQRFDLARLAALLGLVPEALGRSFLTANHRAPGAPLVARSVRFCARCLLAGWHLTMSQWRFLRRCPIHRSPLSRRCPRCTKRTSLDFRLDIALASQPYACSACGQVLAPQLEAPCGRPNAITAAQSLELERWMRTLEHYLAAFSPSAHTRHVRGDDQAKTADRSRARHARWSFLAEIAGVAHRAPPAWPRIGLPDIPASPLQPASLCAKPQHVPVTWRAEHWPHFDPGFATIATLYARERDRLAERIRVDAETSRLLEAHAAPPGITARKADPHRLCADTLAYWLWRMAWEGTSSLRLLHAREHPPFGLTAWLAYAPMATAPSGRDADFPPLAHALTRHVHASFEHARSLVLWMREERRLFMIPKLLAPQLWWLAS